MRISSITKNAGKACNNRLYRHIRNFEKIVKNYFVISNKNIKVFDLHTGMEIAELQKYDVVYLCGGDTTYLLERVNATGFSTTLMEYIKQDGMVIGVSAGSLLFSNNLVGNLGLINTRLDVHCPDGEVRGKVEYPLKDNIRLTNTCAFVIREFPDELEIIGE